MHALKLTLLLGVALLAPGCGIEQPYFLQPPTAQSQATPLSPYFQLSSTAANNEMELSGFELYYKLYSLEQPMDQNFGASSSLVDLSNKGFMPICSETDSSPQNRVAPLIPIDIGVRGQQFTVTIDFNTPGDSTSFQYTSPSSGQPVAVKIRRWVSNGTGGCKTFLPSDFLAGDFDISSIFNSAQTARSFNMAVYALSYGKKNLTTPIWSSPVYLGYVEIHL